MLWKLGSKLVVSGGGDKLFSHSFMKSVENLFILLGVRLLIRADGSSPSAPGERGEEDRNSLLERFLLLLGLLESNALD